MIPRPWLSGAFGEYPCTAPSGDTLPSAAVRAKPGTLHVPGSGWKGGCLPSVAAAAYSLRSPYISTRSTPSSSVETPSR